MKSVAILPNGKNAKSAEAAMLRTLNTFAVDLIQIPSIEDLFWYVAQNVVGRLNFVDCVIYQADEAQTSLQQVAAWGEKNPFGRSILNPLVIPFGRGITGQVAQTRQPVIVDDLLKDQNYIPDTQPARSEICVPLICRGRVVGVIDSEHPDPNAFGEAELEILTTVAAMTGAKLELLAESQRSAQRYNDLVAAHAQLMQETDFRKALEAKLFEARRMESVGKLAGRFAHEFNNLLTVILGNLDLLEHDPTGTDNAQCLGDARASAERGARLVRDLLALAQRTRLDPREVDLNDIVAGYVAAQEGRDGAAAGGRPGARPLAHPGRPQGGGKRAAPSGRERAGCHGSAGHRGDQDRERLPHLGRHPGPRRQPAARPLCPALRHRYRPGHPGRTDVADLRPVLHLETGRGRGGPWPVDRQGADAAIRRTGVCRVRGWQRKHLLPVVPDCGLRQE